MESHCKALQMFHMFAFREIRRNFLQEFLWNSLFGSIYSQLNYFLSNKVSKNLTNKDEAKKLCSIKHLPFPFSFYQNITLKRFFESDPLNEGPEDCVKVFRSFNSLSNSLIPPFSSKTQLRIRKRSENEGDVLSCFANSWGFFSSKG